MNALDKWLAAYDESHQNPTNKLIHNICVPVIFFTVVAALWKFSLLVFVIVAAVSLLFYYSLSKNVAVLGVCMIGLSLIIQWMFDFAWISLIVLFALAWAGQFYGHKIEGKKPSFFEDLQFLLIGPLWVAKPILDKYGFDWLQSN